jgi:hypothetical protein
LQSLALLIANWTKEAIDSLITLEAKSSRGHLRERQAIALATYILAQKWAAVNDFLHVVDV